jgi:hypothetical protein
MGMFSNTLQSIYQIPLGKTVWIVVDVITVLVLFYSMTIQKSKNGEKLK